MNKILKSDIKVLIVDDSEIKMLSLKKFINSQAPNFQIEHAKDQIESIKLLESTKYDLVILDMCLPLRYEEGDLEENGGVNILDEIYFNDDCFHPEKIIVLTEFEELHENVRNQFPEIGSLKYEIGREDWQLGLKRVLKSVSKSNEKKIIIYCEEQNDRLYNLIGLKGLEFRGLKGGSRKVYEAAKFEKDKFSLRDKDFLTKNEVKWLTKTHLTNYFVLDYYCFENYLFHPDNINEYMKLKGIDFDVENYKNDIIAQKQSKLLNIVGNFQIARNSYFDFNDNNKSNVDKTSNDIIINALKSNEFEIFYEYFDMKGADKNRGYDKSILVDFNINKEDLVKTNWFYEKFESKFNSLLNI